MKHENYFLHETKTILCSCYKFAYYHEFTKGFIYEVYQNLYRQHLYYSFIIVSNNLHICQSYFETISLVKYLFAQASN